ncbi:hypothetical protein TpMuguga_01g00671 [Theileria parva strain Muguga]|uniref:RAP domain-containing protein n=1 Tax=Theileria parva TaxID=5875 RepID=Q4N7Z9_THEPA|nr:uncharacterized protein TpMuguga_01g00671 [Theileria parva strain Muguga]EAN33909.1 hypothetical protein TpMuguga_01g00671 [Theileria parva strain Muguga]|eukprot:XP_766192.1 hypothetical protein [Theileria parva strain Muguga]
MCSNGTGILCRMPWSRYSFLSREHVNDGIVPNNLKFILLKGIYNQNDISNVLKLIGKCASDYKLVYNTNWSNIYNAIYSSVSQSDSFWRFGSLVKLLQNASYLSSKLTKSPNINFLKEIISFVTRKLGKNICEVSDKDVVRVIYCCSKGNFLQNSFVPKSFLILLQNEVLQRIKRFETIDLLKLLHSVSNNFDQEFKIFIINRILSKINNLGSDISNLICYLHNYNMLNTNKSILNNNIAKRLYGNLDKDVLITVGLSLVMYKVATLRNLEIILSKFQSLDLNFNDVLMLKLVIYYLKYNNKDLFEMLSDGTRKFVDKILLNFPNHLDYKLFDLNYSSVKQYKKVNQVLKELELEFIPYVHGPYLLPLYDPINQSAIIINHNSNTTGNTVEDSGVNSELLSRVDNFMYNNLAYYNENKLYHLRCEGIKVVEIDQEFFKLNVEEQVNLLNNKVQGI